MRMAATLLALAAGLVGTVAVAALAGQRDEAGVAEADLISNLMLPGFDPDAGLRAAQATRDLSRRVEILARPGRTQIESEDGGHRAAAAVVVETVPNGSVGGSVIGGLAEPGDAMASIAELRVDGCLVDLPPGLALFKDPRAITLSRDGRHWKFEITNNGDGEAYLMTFIFDNQALLAQRLSSGGSYHADWRIAAERYGEARACTRVGSRRFGARAELAAPAR